MKDTILRSLSGILFVLVVLASLLFDKFLFGAFMLLIMGMMMHEFYKMTLGEGFRYSRLLAIISAEILFVLIFLSSAYPETFPAKLIAFAILPTLVVMINSLYSREEDFGKFANIYTGIAYIGIPLSFSNFIVFDSEGEFSGIMLLSFFIIIWASDIGAYIFGISLRNIFPKRLFPSISPNKTWIGFWGGLVCAIAVSVALYFAGMVRQPGAEEIPLFHCIALAAIMHVSGVYGDLFESKWKRTYSVKDSGNSIPGHGGFLDRFDSAIMAVPAASLYIVFIHLF